MMTQESEEADAVTTDDTARDSDFKSSFLKQRRQRTALIEGGRSDADRDANCRGLRDSYARRYSRSKAAEKSDDMHE